ncbi:hypothetical protein BDN72DRAFT_856381 [Pluteus cervinus]|uniref:Uncharacterized protein n=1 Tax=Pluteus cervinus TaxID=181527 RepID=A0ACD3B069_9AGAR|nr:hypothetical protein BDN72DRAFT_856381 [Pluteus cervinus]
MTGGCSGEYGILQRHKALRTQFTATNSLDVCPLHAVALGSSVSVGVRSFVFPTHPRETLHFIPLGWDYSIKSQSDWKVSTSVILNFQLHDMIMTGSGMSQVLNFDLPFNSTLCLSGAPPKNWALNPLDVKLVVWCAGAHKQGPGISGRRHRALGNITDHHLLETGPTHLSPGATATMLTPQ